MKRGDPKRPPDEVLHDSRELLALAMGGGRMGAWSRHLSTGEVWCSRQLEEILGVEPDTCEAGPAGFPATVHEDDLSRVKGAIEGAIQSRGEFTVDFRFRHASGEWRWLEVRGRVVSDATGDPGVLYGVAIDITAHRLARQQQAYATAIIASSDDAILSKTLDGIIISWNAGAERMFGYTAAEVVGKPISIIIPHDLLDEERQILERLRRGERIDHYETVRRTRDGRLLDISLTISPVKDERGRIIGASKIARDITDKKRVEKDREEYLAREQAARTRAEEASRLKDEFLATVSHELRTPLSAILGWARMLSEKRLDPERAQYAAEVLERNARTQVRLIDDLLDVSRIITGQMRLNVRAIMPAGVVGAALDTLKPMAEGKGIRLHSVLDPEAGPISGDSERLQQVVWNLVSNAIKFTPKGGQVQVRLERVDSQVEIAVSDTGQGIVPEFLPHVFDRFRQADPSAKRSFGGLGLGLAIVRHLIELHGGTVWAVSPGPGQGATFTVRFPVTGFLSRPEDERRVHPRVETGRGPLPVEGAPSLKGMRVLILEDEPDTRVLLREMLEQHGAEVRDAGSAPQALQQVQEWRPTVIVSDIGIPGEDGYSFIRKVREWEQTEKTRIPAVALTAYARSEDRVRALLAGYQLHVPKPIDPMEFVLVVASLARALG